MIHLQSSSSFFTPSKNGQKKKESSWSINQAAGCSSWTSRKKKRLDLHQIRIWNCLDIRSLRQLLATRQVIRYKFMSHRRRQTGVLVLGRISSNLDKEKNKRQRTRLILTLSVSLSLCLRLSVSLSNACKLDLGDDDNQRQKPKRFICAESSWLDDSCFPDGTTTSVVGSREGGRQAGIHRRSLACRRLTVVGSEGQGSIHRLSLACRRLTWWLLQ